MPRPQEKQHNKQLLDREQFLKKSNALLQRVERISLMILASGSLLLLVVSKPFSLSLFIGGCMGITHFRSLHRMFQKRILYPKSKAKSQFLYGLSLFLIIGIFFWAIDQTMISTPVLIAGFFLMTSAVLLESKLSARKKVRD